MHPLRTLAFATAAGLSLMAPAAAETRIFIIDNSEGAGIDRCLASGAPCGAQMADDWCRSRDYARAIDFGRVATTGTSAFAPAGLTPSAPTCSAPLCPDAVAITCSR